MYIHQHKNWTNFYWNNDKVITLLAKVKLLQGTILGKMQNIGFDLQKEAVLETLTTEVLKNSEIEGEVLNNEQVRSSVANKLGLEYKSDIYISRDVEGVVQMMMDSTQNFQNPLTQDRLFDWHAALFPTGRSGMHKITVADWRKDDKGPMQVVSGAMGFEKVHFEAPHSDDVPKEMNLFLEWFEDDQPIDPMIKAAVAHLWFVTIHPFDDGNGRISRAITDMQLSRADSTSKRFYTMSAQILNDRKKYYTILEETQKGDSDITEWIVWFLNCLKDSIINADEILGAVLQKSSFWTQHKETSLNDRQRKMINKLFDSFEGKLFSSKWAKICKCSKDTAVRDIQDLIQKGILEKEEGGGRSTSYRLIL